MEHNAAGTIGIQLVHILMATSQVCAWPAGSGYWVSCTLTGSGVDTSSQPDVLAHALGAIHTNVFVFAPKLCLRSCTTSGPCDGINIIPGTYYSLDLYLVPGIQYASALVFALCWARFINTNATRH